MQNIFAKITLKNTSGDINNVICNSAQKGLIPQREYFDKDIANIENTNGYFVIQKGDFVYNPRKSVTAPYGPVSLYNYTDDGIVSPLYLCFRAKESINTNFYEWYFKSSTWHRYIYLYGDSGVRHDRVSIKDSTFFEMPLYIPCKAEQEKLAQFLSLLESNIQKQQQLVDALKSYKRGLVFSIFDNNVPFGIQMTPTPLFDLLTEYRIRDTKDLRVCSVAVNKGIVDQVEHLGRSFSASDTSNYGRVKFGDMVYTKSPTGDFPYGIVKQNKLNEAVAVSPLYGVYTPKTFDVGNLLHYYFEQHENANNYIRPLAQKGAKNTINITNQTFLQGMILFPNSESDCVRLCNILNTIEQNIIKQENLLYCLQQQKKWLLQKMFI